MPRIDAFLKIMQANGVSDLHLSAGARSMLRINGVLEHAEHRSLSEDELKILLYELLTDTQISHLEKEGELDCAYTLASVGRFRINIYKKHPGLGAAIHAASVRAARREWRKSGRDGSQTNYPSRFLTAKWFSPYRRFSDPISFTIESS